MLIRFLITLLLNDSKIKFQIAIIKNDQFGQNLSICAPRRGF